MQPPGSGPELTPGDDLRHMVLKVQVQQLRTSLKLATFVIVVMCGLVVALSFASNFVHRSCSTEPLFGKFTITSTPGTTNTP